MKNRRKSQNGSCYGVAGMGWMFDAMDVGMLSFIIAALKVEWNLSAEQMGWIGSVNSIGMAVGALSFWFNGRPNWSEKCLYHYVIIIFHW